MEEKKEPLTWEQVVEGLYGFKPERKEYSPEELARYRKRLEDYAQEKAAQRAKKRSQDGQEDTSLKNR